ncbi:ATP-binding protein [Sphingobacterium spiritivorum]|uniref:tetratricopeptide repeat-containing sensor histidine kinase n=1 Tax=Sphingobacterium spiritivorum TaxID=258 RepID=UPI003DA4D748
MSIIQLDAGDYFGSNESALLSLTYLNSRDENDFDCLSSNYNELAISSSKLKNYDKSLEYYDLALRYLKNEMSTLIVLNNKAVVYRENLNYSAAINILNEILSKSDLSRKDYARALTNIAYTKWLQNPNYDARPELFKALTIRTQEKDLWGQNSSYAHLSDYYHKSIPDSALYFANHMYAVAKEIKSADDQLEGLQKLIKLSPASLSKHYFEIYQALDDSVQTARNAAKNQFALIRYETEKHKAENLKLQQDNTKKGFMLVSLLFLVLSGSVIVIILYKKRKQRLELKAETAIRENQLRTSKKVHDVVANGLYRVMTEIENQEDLNRENVLDKLEDMYEKSRDISYEKIEFEHQNFHEKMAALLRSFATDQVKVVLIGNTGELWKKVDAKVKYEVEHILQEFMVNMKKHSGASNVAVKFERNDNRIQISYSDNGIGIKDSLQFNNGLKNTGTRIENIQGAITFETQTERGLKIQFSFPVS